MTVTTRQHDRDRAIRLAQEAVIARMKRDPVSARSTIRSTGHIGDGLACHVAQGDLRATLDFAPGMGGDGAGPSPGFFARAAIAGCVAIAVKMLAAREGLHLEAVDVSVEMDFDDSALFGMGACSAAPLTTRIGIEVTTEVPEAAVQALIARALAMDPYYLALRDPQQVSHEVSVRAPG